MSRSWQNSESCRVILCFADYNFAVTFNTRRNTMEFGMHQKAANSFRELIQQAQAGSPEAFHRIIEQYGGHVYRAVRRRMDRRVRSKFDSDDFVQAVWVSFFEKRKQIGSFAKPEQLIGFLAQVASNKVTDECRRRLWAKQFDVRRERRINYPRQIAGRSPTPSAIVMADEQKDLLAQDQRKTHLQILELRTLGATFEEIADKLGVAEKTIQRVLKRMSRRIVQ